MFAFFKLKSSKTKVKTARKFQRRAASAAWANALINETVFAIMDWSFGSISLATKDVRFVPAQTLFMTLQFQVGGRAMEVQQTGTVVRAENGITAIRFENPTAALLRCLRQIADYAAARRR